MDYRTLLKVDMENSNKVFLLLSYILNASLLVYGTLNFYLANEIDYVYYIVNIVYLLFLLALTLFENKNNPILLKNLLITGYGVYLFFVVFAFCRADINLLYFVVSGIFLGFTYISMSLYKRFFLTTFSLLIVLNLLYYFILPNNFKLVLFHDIVLMASYAAGYIVLQRVISILRRVTEYDLANSDNKIYTKEFLGERIEFLKNKSQTLSMIAVGVDDMKGINRNFGVSAGDEILEQFVETIKTALRGTDFIYRLQGDTVVVLANHNNDFDVLELTQRLRYKINENNYRFTDKEGNDSTTKITAGFGAATLIEGESSDNLLKRCFDALSAAKKQGRDSVVKDNSLK